MLWKGIGANKEYPPIPFRDSPGPYPLEGGPEREPQGLIFKERRKRETEKKETKKRIKIKRRKKYIYNYIYKYI